MPAGRFRGKEYDLVSVEEARDLTGDKRMDPLEREAEALVSKLCEQHSYHHEMVFPPSLPPGYVEQLKQTAIPASLGRYAGATVNLDCREKKYRGDTYYRLSMYAMNREDLVSLIKQVIQLQHRPRLKAQLLRGGDGPSRGPM